MTKKQTKKQKTIVFWFIFVYTRIYSNATNLEMEKVIATEIVSPNPESGYNYSVIFGFEKNFDKQVRTSAGMHTKAPLAINCTRYEHMKPRSSLKAGHWRVEIVTKSDGMPVCVVCLCSLYEIQRLTRSWDAA